MTVRADARLLRVVPRALEPRDRARAARSVPARRPRRRPATCRRASARSSRSSPPSAPSPSCSCSTSRRRASIRSSGASSSRPSSARTRKATPGERTVFVSTHLISEFEGLIDEFTIIDHGPRRADARRRRGARAAIRRSTRASPATRRRARPRRRARAAPAAVASSRSLVNGNAADVIERLRARSPEALETEALTLEEIFVATLQPARGSAALA